MTGEVDVLIVTALPEERAAARTVLTAGVDGMRVATWSEAGDEDAPYLVGELFGEDGAKLRVALGRPTRMGATSAASFTTTLAERLKPRCLAMTGVCAGNPSDVALGDVIVAELTYAYDEGKRTQNGFEGDHRQWPAPDPWVRAAQELDSAGLPSQGAATVDDAELWLLERLYHGGDPRTHPALKRYFPIGEWKPAVLDLERRGLVTREANALAIADAGRDRVNQALVYDSVDPPSVLPFKVLTGPIASGNVVVKDGVTWDSLKAMGMRTVIGLEMEAAAIGLVARSKGIQNWIVVKGVMDHADPKKDDRYKPFAARASAEVLVRLLRKMMLAREASHESFFDRLKGRADSSRHEAGSSNFVNDPTPATLPPGLRREPGHLILHREAVLEALFALYRDPAPGNLALLTGPPRAGKSDAISRFVLALVMPEEQEEPGIGLLYVDLTSTSRPKRAVYRAVSGHGRGAGILPYGDEDDEQEEEAIDREAEYLQDVIPVRLKGRRLVTVLENYADIAGRKQNRESLEQLLGLVPFRRGFSLVEAELAVLKPARLALVNIDHPSLTSEQGADFLTRCFGLQAIAAATMQSVVELDGLQTLLPGITHDGVVVHLSRAARAGAEPDAENLALTILTQASEIAEAVVTRLVAESGGDDDSARGALLTLMVLAVYDGISSTEDQRAELDLAAIPVRGLAGIGWLERVIDGDRLRRFGRDALRAAARSTLGGGAGGPLGIGPRELLLRLEKTADALFGEREDAQSDALERAVGLLDRVLPSENALLLRLKALLNLEHVFDPVPPFSAEEDRVLASEFQRLGAEGDLDFAVAALAGHAREASERPQRDREDLRSDYRQALETIANLIESGAELSYRHFFALDSAVYVGARRLHLFAEANAFYQRMLKALAGQELRALERGHGAWLAAWASLLLNAAELSLSGDDATAARDPMARAAAIIEQGGALIDNARKQWLRSRLALLRERLATNPEERLAALAEASESAALALAHLPDSPRGLRYYLRTVRRQVDAEGDEDQRKGHVDAARGVIEAIHGPPEYWDVAARAQFAALMRQEARRSWNMRYQQDRARAALALLRLENNVGDEQIRLNAQACLAQARLHAFLGDQEAARNCCNHALELAPGAAAWHLKLRLLDGPQGGKEDWNDEPAREGRLPPALKKGINEFRKWAKSEPWPSPAIGRVELWCCERQWRVQGSLERWAALQQEQKEGATPFALLDRQAKGEKLRILYERRRNVLDGIEARYGELLELVHARMFLEAQHLRSDSVIRGNMPKVSRAFDVVNHALRGRWHNNHLLQYRKAEYQRYIWDVEGATRSLRQVMASATNGDLRRRAAVSLVRTLHTVAAYADDFRGKMRRHEMEQARDLANQLIGAFDHAENIAVLRDHIALELGEQVDWSELEGIYDKVVGRIDGFPSTLICEYDAVKADQSDNAPRNTAEVLRANFADPGVLGLAGLLYLRRAELAVGNDRAADFERAVALFLAGSLIERTWEGNERAVTSLRIARAIVSAAEALHSLNPIPGLPTGDRLDQLDLAIQMLRRATHRSTGQFRDVLKRWIQQAEIADARLRAG